MDIDWKNVRKVLVVRLRSIGDTVLTTPSLIALRKFLPDAQIDIVLEDWVAPVLDGFTTVDNVLTVSKKTWDRFNLARQLRREKYDVAFNLHGGTTATFLVRASGAKHRVGYASYSYSFLFNQRLKSSADFWKKDPTHSAEHQMALLGFVGVPVADQQKTQLTVVDSAMDSATVKFTAEAQRCGVVESEGFESSRFALIHPAAAFETKTVGAGEVCPSRRPSFAYPCSTGCGGDKSRTRSNRSHE